MEMVNELMQNLAKEINYFQLIEYDLFQLTVIDKNVECGGLDAAKKSAISTFRAKQKFSFKNKRFI